MSSPITIENKEKADSTIFILHGLGDTGKGWVDVANIITEKFPKTKVILPTAPTRAVTANMGMEMPAWFDIYGFSETSKRDDDGIKKSSEILNKLIEEEVSKSKKIIIGGFSQGGVIALYTALFLTKVKLDGVIGLSCFVPVSKEKPQEILENNKETPFIICHGDSDSLIPLNWAERSAKFLQANDLDVKFNVYKNLPHGISEQVIDDVLNWLSKIL
ncbi:lysophospholipase-related [Anaeramoeba ignava]|uniref:Lysophospholipase-related n=1 Tax=Anaeramoeba ignava TaxID=1746090 RepID=A0A9Q0LT42_ANAIG|nr:lysophospholipase-related [Anaeramoeba ignava]